MVQHYYPQSNLHQVDVYPLCQRNETVLRLNETQAGWHGSGRVCEGCYDRLHGRFLKGHEQIVRLCDRRQKRTPQWPSDHDLVDLL